MAGAACWDSKLFNSYQGSGGQYSSYPTNKHFCSNISEFERFAALRASNQNQRKLTVYVEIPCIAQENYPAYLVALQHEISTLARLYQQDQKLEHLYVTGSPDRLQISQLQQLMLHLSKHFRIEGQNLANYSININPYQTNWAYIGAVRDIGFNRIVLEAHADDYKFSQLQTIYEAARTMHFSSISLDVLYGQPQQGVNNFHRQLEQIVQLMPERIRLKQYPQSSSFNQVPELLERALHNLVSAGYLYIGMNCFALPDDDLISAREAGLLTHNLQGCVTSDEFDILGFGIAAASQVGDINYQNTSVMSDYLASFHNKQLPPAKGMVCNKDDLIRRFVIHTLTNQLALPIPELENKFKIVFTHYFHEQMPHLRQMHLDGLIKLDSKELSLKPGGYLLVDSVCQLFDKFSNSAL